MLAAAFALGCDAGETGAGGAGATRSTTAANATSATHATTSASTSVDASSSATGSSVPGDIGASAASCALPPPPPDPTCEAIGGGRCYYVSAEDGDDEDGDGSFEAPWASLANVVSYYGTPGENGSTASPANAIDLAPGDVVYLRAGTYDRTYNYQGEILVARFRGVDGTEAAPIALLAYRDEKPVIDPGGAGVGIDILQSRHWRVRGIEVTNAYGAGVRVGESADVTLSHLVVHDTDGVDNDNVAGVYVSGSADVDLGCSVVHDNYDRISADTGGEATENSANLVAFGGGSLRVHHNDIFQTPETSASKSGGCVKYKHAASDPDAVFEVTHNRLSRCKFFGVGTGTQHSHVSRNLIRDGEGIVSRDFGGPTHQTDQRFEHNTFYRAPALELSPTLDWRDATFSDPRDIVFARNVVLFPLDAPSQERGTVVIGTYGSDALYDATVPELTFADNCYQNPAGAPTFSLFAANGGSYGDEGDEHDFASWRALGFDLGSVVADPGFVDAEGGDLRLDPGSPCRDMGAFAP